MPLRLVEPAPLPGKRERSPAWLGLGALGLAALAMLYGWPVGVGRPAPTAPAVAESEVRPAEPVQSLDSLHCAARNPATAREVAVLDLNGALGAGFKSDAVYALLNRITGNPRIGAVALRIDSTGGDSYVAKKVHEALLKTKRACALPMAAFIGNVGTSGAYWIAQAADEIHADTLSTVGSVGVVAVYSNESEKLEKEGIRHAVIRTGERKWPLMPYLPVKDGDVQKIRDSLDIVLAEYVAAVESSRQGKLKLNRAQLTTGEAWMGRDAYALGLVDAPEDVSSASTRLLGGAPTAYRFFDLAKTLEGEAAG